MGLWSLRANCVVYIIVVQFNYSTTVRTYTVNALTKVHCYEFSINKRFALVILKKMYVYLVQYLFFTSVSRHILILDRILQTVRNI